MTDPSPEDYRIYLEEACYHLHRKGLSFEELSQRLEVSPAEAEQFYHSYMDKLKNGIVEEDIIDSRVWGDIHDDAIGNEKVTFVRDDGFYHCKKSDLEAMENTSLMAIFESSKKFLDFDIYKRYLNSKPPVGYDPMALQRQVNRATVLIEDILKRRYEKDRDKSNPNIVDSNH